jgi:hypothetical protein
MKKYYSWLALVVALTLNTLGEPGLAEGNAAKTSGGEEVVEPGQKLSENPNSREGRYSDAGSWELGGTTSITTNTSADGSTSNILIIGTVLNFFPVRLVFLGPIVAYSGQWVGTTSASELNLGLRLGIALPLGSDKFYMYLGSGFAWATLSVTNDVGYYDQTQSVSYDGTMVPIFFGIKIVIQKHISLNIEPSYQITTFNGKTSTQFIFGWGISGLIF